MSTIQYIEQELEELEHRYYRARVNGTANEVKPLLLEQCFFIAKLIQEVKTTPFNFYSKYQLKKFLFNIAISIHENY